MKEIKWGVIFTLAMILWMFLERLVGLHSEHIQHHSVATNAFALVAIVIYCLALRDKRKSQLDGKARWLTLFWSGLKISVVIAVLSPLAQFIIHSYISPEFFPVMREYAISSGMMSDIKANKYFTLQVYMAQSAVFAFGMGLITSAIVALFMKRK